MLCALALALACTACLDVTPYMRDTTAGLIGCPAAEIDVSDATRDTWTATCRGRRYHCSATPQAKCAPEGTSVREGSP
jgi:hypothetical protein